MAICLRVETSRVGCLAFRTVNRGNVRLLITAELAKKQVEGLGRGQIVKDWGRKSVTQSADIFLPQAHGASAGPNKHCERAQKEKLQDLHLSSVF